ncbi:DnaB-like helicase C-terminal domain-containing protein, partial [Mameliella sp. CS4]|uniref:DnaB-like helicase C-terminal domain-containing protein n=1 Tax=Mameliella sp. CS4 TaxID=2862329 RepID=UPI001C600364
EDLDAVASAGLATTMQRVTLAQSTSSALARVARVRAGLEPPGVSYGIPKLDRATLGMRPDQLIVLAGRPGMGKTAVAL